MDQAKLGKPVAITCPDCGGALSSGKASVDGQFRCHIGHVYTAEGMVFGQLLAMDKFLKAALRSLNERADICRQMAQDADNPGRAHNSADWIKAMKEAFDKTGRLEELLAHKWITPAVGRSLEADGNETRRGAKSS